jgi:hypothetical protein
MAPLSWTGGSLNRTRALPPWLGILMSIGRFVKMQDFACC